jgi:hypothetical protein
MKEVIEMNTYETPNQQQSVRTPLISRSDQSGLQQRSNVRPYPP